MLNWEWEINNIDVTAALKSITPTQQMLVTQTAVKIVHWSKQQKIEKYTFDWILLEKKNVLFLR
jgi:hypothetical protein